MDPTRVKFESYSTKIAQAFTSNISSVEQIQEKALVLGVTIIVVVVPSWSTVAKHTRVVTTVSMVTVVVPSSMVGDQEVEKAAGEGLPGRMSILEGAVFGGGHDEVFDGDFVELRERLGLRHRRHVIQAKAEAKLLQIRRL